MFDEIKQIYRFSFYIYYQVALGNVGTVLDQSESSMKGSQVGHGALQTCNVIPTCNVISTCNVIPTCCNIRTCNDFPSCNVIPTCNIIPTFCVIPT